MRGGSIDVKSMAMLYLRVCEYCVWELLMIRKILFDVSYGGVEMMPQLRIAIFVSESEFCFEYGIFFF